MNLDALDIWMDPQTGGRLALLEAVETNDGQLVYAFLQQTDGSVVYPVLGGVPVLVADPTGWCGRYGDAMLASLAESGHVGHSGLMMARLFARTGGPWEQAHFTDDWVPNEDAPYRPPEETEAAKLFAQFLDAAERGTARDAIVDAVGDGGVVLDVGCGKGPLVGHISCKEHWAADLSLRAVLQAAQKGAKPVVLDAENIPAAPDSFDTVVAAGLVDLLEDPEAFLQGAARALKRGGKLVVTTPNPSLGRGEYEDDVLSELIQESGLSIRSVSDSLPWVRIHHERYTQVYFVRLVVAAKVD